MKCQVLLSLKNNEKVFTIVICCSHDWHFNGFCKNKLEVQIALQIIRGIRDHLGIIFNILYETV